MSGKHVFDTDCNTCHPGGQQGTGPSLMGVTSRLDGSEVWATIRGGRGQMPGFHRLSDKQLDDVVTFLETLK